MKKVFFTMFIIALMAISENAICQAILITNCTGWNEEQLCLETDQWGRTEVTIIVDFRNDPDDHEDTNWYVRFHPSPIAPGYAAANRIFYKGNFTKNEGVWSYKYIVSLGASSVSSSFYSTLYSQNNVDLMVRDSPGPHKPGFFICQGNNKLSNLNSSNFEGIKNTSNENFDEYNIYPNPIEQDFTVEYQAIENEVVTFEILDIEGRTIYTSQFEHQHTGFNSKQIENLDLVKGLYFCRIQTANSQKTIKVTKL